MPKVAMPVIEVEGTPLPASVDHLIEQIVVDDSHTLPDMFVLRFHDPDHVVLDRSGLAIGAKVRILAGAVGSPATTVLIQGEVTALEAEIDDTGSRLVARGYDRSHRLQRGLHTRTFVDTTESDIVRRVAREAGIEVGEIEDSPGTLTFVSQANQTDFDFLRGRAREIGFDVGVREDKLFFQPPVDSSTAPSSGLFGLSLTQDPQILTFGSNLNEFRPRITAGKQVAEIEVRGWDPDTQKAVVVSSQGATTSAVVDVLDPGSIADIFGDSKFVIGDRPLTDSDALQRVADSAAEQIGSAFAEADGVADGDPLLRAGTPISITGVGKPFEGQYTITASRHVIGANGYNTHFTVSGRQERSLLGLASLGDTAGDASAGGEPIYGVVVGIVTDSTDPTTSGRVKLSFPWLADDYESDWARLVAPGAGNGYGISFVPEVGDEVLVAFERGDVRSPFVLGGLWSGKNVPPQASDLVGGSGTVDLRVVQSRLGHALTLSDADGADGIAIVSQDGDYTVNVNVAEKQVELTAPSCSIIMQQDGTVSISATSLELSGTSITIKADGKLDLQAANVSITSKGPAAIKGSPLALN